MKQDWLFYGLGNFCIGLLLPLGPLSSGWVLVFLLTAGFITWQVLLALTCISLNLSVLRWTLYEQPSPARNVFLLLSSVGSVVAVLSFIATAVLHGR